MIDCGSSSWKLLKVSDFADVVGGGTPSTGDTGNFGDGVPWITPKDLSAHRSRYISHGERSLTAKGLSGSSAKRLPAGSVLVSSRAPIGLTAIAQNEVSTNQGFRSLVLKADLADSEFIYYLMSASTDYLHSHANGTTFMELPGGVFKNLEFLLPPLKEQRQIAEVLGGIDDRIEACGRIAGLCDKLFQARWEMIFSENQESPKGALRDLCTSQYGVTASGTRDQVGPRLLRVTDINKFNWVDWRTVPYCSVSEDELAKYSLKFGDVVVARMADPGKSAIVEVPELSVFASYLIRISPKVPNASYFLFGFLKSRHFVDYAEGASSGSVQQNMNAQTILSSPCSIPSPEELSDFEGWAREVRQGVIAAVRERNALLDLREFLLPRLVSGELRVSEALDIAEAAL